MDLLNKETGGSGRVLAARHVTIEKPHPDTNNAINTTLLCHSSMETNPKFSQYSAGLQFYGPVLWSCGALAVIISVLLFILTLKAVRLHRPTIFKHAVFVLSIYPVVTMSAYITTLVPRARLVLEAVAQQSVMVGMFHLFGLLMAECGGINQFINRTSGSRLETRVLPCCCWPCCPIPRPEIKRSSLATVRYLVIQMPVTQALIYVVFLVLWAEDEELYKKSVVWIQPLIAASILLGVWGIIMTVRAVEAAGVACRAKFLLLQIVILILKLQFGLANVLPHLVTIPCFITLHPSVLMFLLHNLAVMLEMVLLSLWAWRVYSSPPRKPIDKVVVAHIPDADKSRTPEITYQRRSERKY